MPETSLETPAVQPQLHLEVGANGREFYRTAVQHRLTDAAEVVGGLAIAALSAHGLSDIPESSSVIGKALELLPVIGGLGFAVHGVFKYLQHRKLK